MPDSLFLRYVVLAGAAFVAGVFNAIAGGGSFFSFPALLGMHLAPVNANATNTVALWPGHIASLFALRRELKQIGPRLVPVGIASAAGGVAGAVALLLTRQDVFMRLVPWLLLIATTLFLFSDRARRWLENRRTTKRLASATTPKVMSARLLLALTLVCAYIGYFGAGAAFLIYAVFAVSGGLASMYEVIAVKSLCNAVANAVAIVTFVIAGAVYWRECLVMIALASIGGYTGSVYALRFSPRVLRAVVIVTGFFFAAYYFWKVYF
jgi:uncharacterized membrane protein YfcA